MESVCPAVVPVNTVLYGADMAERLTAQGWIDFALTTLAREGFDAIKADILARKLGVSRGSFYWHFAELGTFHARVIEHWRQLATEAIIADLERYDSREQRLEALLRRGFGHDGLLEVRMRAWAGNNADAARVVGDIDRRRRSYIERLLVDAGIAPAAAATRAQLLYWAYLGAAWSGSKLSGERLERMVAELKLIGLHGLAERPAGIAARQPRRASRSARRR
jgi:AcrR family transcriptional regulator